MERPVLLGLGANVGDALATLAAAVDLLGDVLTVTDVSSVYATPPWPGPDDPRHVPQDEYLNLVGRGEGGPGPEALLDAALELEALLGRDRAREVRWGPRPIDIDLLLHGDEVRDTPRLVLPHPRLAERAFVLVPALEVWPGGSLPDGRRFADLLAGLSPVEGIELGGRLPEAPTTRIPRPDGPVAPPADFARPAVARVAREHGA
ncbi:MAG: 2-amino-4-hydroxy-6-hydroxymethyldihydropteridine diphosphokinase [Nitriliruptoraceae bacterium]